MQLRQLLSYEKFGLRHIQGSLDSEVFNVLPPERCDSSSLVFVSKQEMVESAAARGARTFIRTPAVQGAFPNEACIFEVPSVSLGLALVLPHFDRKAERFYNSETAVVHPTARIGDQVVLGPFAVIGPHAIIGSGCRIGAHTVVENNCVVGSKTTLHPHVYIGAQTEIGVECEIHSHTSVGPDGFGYVTNPTDGRHHKVPQIGRVVIEDRVEIGANCAIDRATLTETRIKAGTKIDNLVHIAHNCEIGENGLLTAGFIIAGSSKVGRQFVCGGQVGVSDHITIGDNVALAGRTGVLRDITEPGHYGGMPTVKIQQYLKISRALLDLPEIWKWWRQNQKS
ncbi:MAG: UDP-3-O-(3-hydroxymyristoyl)glucosamine N-acyltransferase [Bdellovibrionales bacterium]